jgi:hypothetical protein
MTAPAVFATGKEPSMKIEYKFADETMEIEVSDEWGSILIDLDRQEYNNNHKGGSRPTYTAYCYTYPNGSEEDAMDCDTFEFTSLSKAKAKCDEFAAECESLKYAGAHVEDDHGKYLYEILTDGTVNQ